MNSPGVTDKTGISGDRFYREYIPLAERILREYLAEIEEEEVDG